MKELPKELSMNRRSRHVHALSEKENFPRGPKLMRYPSSALRFAVLGLSLALACSLAATPASFGQVVSTNGGSIEGIITDSSGAIVPGATVMIADPDLGYARMLVTDRGGLYSEGPLDPGNYTVTITAKGFTTLKVDTVVRT